MGRRKIYMIGIVILIMLLCIVLVMCFGNNDKQPVDDNSNNEVEDIYDSEQENEGGLTGEAGGIGYEEEFDDFMSDDNGTSNSQAEDDTQQNGSQKDDTEKGDSPTKDNVSKEEPEEDKNLPEGELEKGSWGPLF